MKLFPSHVSTKAYELSQLMPALQPFWSPLLFLASEAVVSIAREEIKNYEAVFIQRSCILVNLPRHSTTTHRGNRVFAANREFNIL
jgi:hypothetical protein